MTNTCPTCGSTNTTELEGTDYMNLLCRDCHQMSIIDWKDYKALAEKLTEELRLVASALEEITDAGLAAWGADRPCVQQAQSALSKTKIRVQTDNSLDTLRRIANILNAEDPESYRSDDPEGAMDTAFALAQEAITKATGV